MNKIVGLYLAIGCVRLAAQAGQVSGRPVPDLDERTLQEKYHIAPTEKGLIGALRHQQSIVRSFAAAKLADDGDKAAIRPILDALAVEMLKGVKINLATAAAQLGAAEGFEALKSMCEDLSWSPTLRMVAAQSMLLNLGREECLSDILDVLRSEPDANTLEGLQAPAMALNLLTFKRFKHIQPSQLDEIRDLAAVYLKSQQPALRIAASQCIRDLGGPWAISQLRIALDAEQNGAVRASIAKDLFSVRQ